MHTELAFNFVCDRCVPEWASRESKKEQDVYTAGPS